MGMNIPRIFPESKIESQNYKILTHTYKKFTYFSVSVVIIEYTEGYGRQDAGKVEEEGGRDDLLKGLVTYDPVPVIWEVVGHAPLEILPQAPRETTSPLLLQ